MAARNGLALQAFATAALLLGPAVVRAEEGEPSIEQMWAKIEVRLGATGRRNGPATKGAPAGKPEEKRAGAAKDKKDKSAAADKKMAAKRRPLDFGQLLKRLNVRAQELFGLCRRDRDQFGAAVIHVRLEAFDMAAGILEKMVERGNTAGRAGRVEGEYAGAIVHLGRHDLAMQQVPTSERLLAEALKGEDLERRPNNSTVNALKSKHKFVRKYPGASKRLAKLRASLAKAPNAGKFWQLVRLYDADGQGVRLAVHWLKGIHEMRVRYPDHKANRNGNSDRMLSRAYRHHAMYEECIAHVRQVLKDGPKTSPYVAKGQAHFDRAHSQELLAMHHWRMRQRARALDGFQKALKLYREFQKELPDCWYIKREEGGDPPLVERRISEVCKYIKELGGTP